MSLKIRPKQVEWLKNKAPEQAADYLDEALNSLYKGSRGRISKAVDMNENNEFDGGGISLNGAETQVTDVNQDSKNLAMVADILGDGIVKSEEVEPVANEVTTEVVAETTTDEVEVAKEVVSEEPVSISETNPEVTTEVNEAEDFANLLKGTIVNALKEYHETVVVPLLDVVDELKQVNTELRQKLENTSVSKSKDGNKVPSAVFSFINNDLLSPTAVAAVVKENFSSQEFSGKTVDNAALAETVVENVTVVKTNEKKQWYEGL